MVAGSVATAGSKNNNGRKPNPQKKNKRKPLPKTDGENNLPMSIRQLNMAKVQRRGAPAASSIRMRMTDNSRGTFVSLVQPAKPFVAADFGEDNRLVFQRRIGP